MEHSEHRTYEIPKKLEATHRFREWSRLSRFKIWNFELPEKFEKRSVWHSIGVSIFYNHSMYIVMFCHEISLDTSIVKIGHEIGKLQIWKILEYSVPFFHSMSAAFLQVFQPRCCYDLI